MSLIDIFYVIKWWFSILVIGLIFLPTTLIVFSNFKDKGYIFAKILGIVFISYFVFILSYLRVIEFSRFEIFLTAGLFFIINLFILKRNNLFSVIGQNIKIFIIEEFIFILTLFFWSFIRANLPDIHGLEKFMDFGMTNSILRSTYFPPLDMWYSGFPINYYYFGHLTTAVLIKFSDIASNIGYNLMLATIFAFSFTSVLSLSLNIFSLKKFSLKSIIAGILSASILSLGGNLTTIYTFFKAYEPLDKAVPFWTLPFLPLSFPNNYWYPNATRFIPFTIHEFPIYSYVVSDLHGHVLDIPFVLLTIALIFSIFLKRVIEKKYLLLISFLLSILYMTNAWDGLIYMLLSLIVLIFISIYKKGGWKLNVNNFINYAKNVVLIFAGFFAFALPFSLKFKPFVSGIGVICAPKFLTDIGKIGPFLFEANHCQRSPLWQLLILYGFFYFFVLCFILFLKFKRKYVITTSDKFVSFLIIISTLLIIVPEFIYIKDIYPLHYRANTMFKLTYEAFMMLSISSGYIIVKIISELKNKIIILLFFVSTLVLLYFVLSYPVFAINSYYDNLKSYKNLNGTLYLKNLYPNDYNLIEWLNKNIKGSPVILEANGDSYTDYSRISANTGLPTVIGWPVHEWLWRGTYEIVAPRISDVEKMYTSKDILLVKNLLKKYKIKFVIISSLEKQKYPDLYEQNFRVLGKIIYKSGSARIYKIVI